MTSPARLTYPDFYQSLRLLLVIAVGLVIFCLLAQISGYLTDHDFEWSPFSHLWFLFSKVWLPAVAASPLVLLAALRFPLVPGAWRGALVAHVLVFLALSLLHSLVLSFLYHYFADMPAHMQGYKPWQHAGHFMFGDGVFLFDGIIYLLLVAGANLRHFYFVAQAKDVEASQLGHQLTLARLQSLRMQINPHFLFNTLNAISVLVMKHEQQKAVEMIGRLSYLFRQSLSETQVLITLEAELDSARQYLDIEKVRFGERLEYSINCEPALLAKQVPSMLLQPLLENAVRHGFAQKTETGILTIECKAEGEFLCIYISDNGAGFDTQQQPTGIGMENVRQRLASHYGDSYGFLVDSQPAQGTRISISLPLREGEKA